MVYQNDETHLLIGFALFYGVKVSEGIVNHYIYGDENFNGFNSCWLEFFLVTYLACEIEYTNSDWQHLVSV